MKLRFLFRFYMLFMAGILAWCVLTYAQGANQQVQVAVQDGAGTSTVAIQTQAPTTLSFGLHKIPELRHEVLGIPIWQYIACAIFVWIAFVVARLSTKSPHRS